MVSGSLVKGAMGTFGRGLVCLAPPTGGMEGVGRARVTKGTFQSSLTTCIVKSSSWLERHDVTFDKTS